MTDVPKRTAILRALHDISVSFTHNSETRTSTLTSTDTQKTRALVKLHAVLFKLVMLNYFRISFLLNNMFVPLRYTHWFSQCTHKDLVTNFFRRMIFYLRTNLTLLHLTTFFISVLLTLSTLNVSIIL